VSSNSWKPNGTGSSKLRPEERAAALDMSCVQAWHHDRRRHIDSLVSGCHHSYVRLSMTEAVACMKGVCHDNGIELSNARRHQNKTSIPDSNGSPQERVRLRSSAGIIFML